MEETERAEGELERVALVVPEPRRLDHELHGEQPAAFDDEHGPVLNERRRHGAGSRRGAFGREPREAVADMHRRAAGELRRLRRTIMSAASGDHCANDACARVS